MALAGPIYGLKTTLPAVGLPDGGVFTVPPKVRNVPDITPLLTDAPLAVIIPVITKTTVVALAINRPVLEFRKTPMEIVYYFT